MRHPLLTASTGYHSTILEHEHTVKVYAVLERPQKTVELAPQLASWQHAGFQHKIHKNGKPLYRNSGANFCFENRKVQPSIHAGTKIHLHGFHASSGGLSICIFLLSGAQRSHVIHILAVFFFSQSFA